MSDVMDAALAALSQKMPGGFDAGRVRFDLEDEGSILVDDAGVHAADGGAEADVVMAAAPDVFRQILDGDLSAMAAFMSGRLKVDGDMGLAVKLGTVLG